MSHNRLCTKVIFLTFTETFTETKKEFSLGILSEFRVELLLDPFRKFLTIFIPSKWFKKATFKSLKNFYKIVL